MKNLGTSLHYETSRHHKESQSFHLSKLLIVVSGLLTWDCTDCHVDLERELQAIVASKPEGDEARYGKFVRKYLEHEY